MKAFRNVVATMLALALAGAPGLALASAISSGIVFALMLLASTITLWVEPTSEIAV